MFRATILAFALIVAVPTAQAFELDCYPVEATDQVNKSLGMERFAHGITENQRTGETGLIVIWSSPDGDQQVSIMLRPNPDVACPLTGGYGLEVIKDAGEPS